MKKTIIALMALAGAAAAQTTDVTLGSWYTDNGESFLTLDAVYGKTAAGCAGILEAGSDGELTASASFTIDTDALLMSGVKVGDTVTISSIQVASAIGGYGIGGGSSSPRTMTITLGGNTYVSEAQQSDKPDGAYGVLTYNFTGNNVFSFTVGDDLGVSIDAQNTVVHQQLGVFKNQTGVSAITSADGGVNGWQAAVKLNGTVTPAVPEPTTATLSLLALAGLAARRRRK